MGFGGPGGHSGVCVPCLSAEGTSIQALFPLSQLLTAQGIRCTHIYSSLDQTARKINIAKFSQGKCPVLLVTDVAARGLDIPMLDNVINFSFPAKGKLFLHRVGGCQWVCCDIEGQIGDKTVSLMSQLDC